MYMWGLIILFALALLATIATHLAVYYQKTHLFQEWFEVLLVADIVLMAVLFIAIAWMVARLILSWRRGERGARLSLRLTILLWVMSLLPTLLLYTVSVGTVFRGIELWFDTPLGQSFERGIEFGQDVVGQEFRRLEYVAFDVATGLRTQGGYTPFYIEDVKLFYNLDSIALYDGNGRPLIASGDSGTEAVSSELAKRVIDEGLYLNLQGDDINRIVQVAVPVVQNRQTSILLVSRVLPADIAQGLAEIEHGQTEYKKLRILRTGLHWSFILTMSLSLSLILFAAGWIALRLGRILTRPLVQLSAAAEAVGKGDLARQLSAEHPMAEIKQLNLSFNKMVNDLSYSRHQVAERQEALHKTNAYLENLLSSLTTGVLTFSADRALSGYNKAAAAYYGEPLQVGARRLPVSVLTDHITKALIALTSADQESPVEDRVVVPDGRVLLMRVLLLPDAAGGGILVMIDDISRQIRAEREATWVEASRRFVHEIKNPLTPIQLAAERLQDKLEVKLSGSDSEILTRLVHTIVNQVDAMRQMVDSFRDYADKRSAPLSTPVQLNALLGELSYFYENRGAEIKTDLQSDLPTVPGNAVTLRQLFHNVLGNAIDALADTAAPVIHIQSAEAGRYVKIVIEDNGGGVPVDRLEKLCEPYVTTKPQGTGLGLAVVRKTVDEHNGRLEIENGRHGLRLTVWLVKN